jgi:hypothetical protein
MLGRLGSEARIPPLAKRLGTTAAQPVKDAPAYTDAKILAQNMFSWETAAGTTEQTTE